MIFLTGSVTAGNIDSPYYKEGVRNEKDCIIINRRIRIIDVEPVCAAENIP